MADYLQIIYILFTNYSPPSIDPLHTYCISHTKVRLPKLLLLFVKMLFVKKREYQLYWNSKIILQYFYYIFPSLIYGTIRLNETIFEKITVLLEYSGNVNKVQISFFSFLLGLSISNLLRLSYCTEFGCS
jgi:hypothetical protein